MKVPRFEPKFISFEQQSSTQNIKKQSTKDNLSFVDLENLDFPVILEEDEPKSFLRSLQRQHW